MVCCLLLGLCLALTGTSVAQNQFYVNSSTGNDSNDGSQARPWKTIQHADSALTLGTNGTIVNVAAGNYSGPITTNRSGTPTQRIVWQGAPNYGTKISMINWSVNGSYTDVVGFEGTSPGGNGFAIQIGPPSGNSNSVHILNNYFHDFGTAACGPYGVINDIPHPYPGAVHSDDWFIGNVIRHFGNYLPGPTNCVSSQGLGISIATASWSKTISFPGLPHGESRELCCREVLGPDIISNNTVFNNGGGIVIDENNGVQGPAWDYSAMSNNIVVNNGLAGSGGSGFGIEYYHATGTHNVVANNMVYGQPALGLRSSWRKLHRGHPDQRLRRGWDGLRLPKY